MGKSTISWTNETDNPIYLKREDGTHGGHWCRKTAPECTNCFAESVNQNGFFAFASHRPYTGQVPKNLYFDQAIIDTWARKTKPAKRFVCSMTDLFGEWVPRAWQFAVFDAALAAPKQTIQLLTKRPAIAAQAMQEWCHERGKTMLPENVWMGVSVGSQETADRFEDDARKMWKLCEITWVSYEPALGPVAWGGWEFITWLVIGGESGPEARPFYLEWAVSAIAWCRQNDIAPYIKQMGSFPVSGESGLQLRTTGKGTDPSEWPECLRVREFPSKKQEI